MGQIIETNKLALRFIKSPILFCQENCNDEPEGISVAI